MGALPSGLLFPPFSKSASNFAMSALSLAERLIVRSPSWTACCGAVCVSLSAPIMSTNNFARSVLSVAAIFDGAVELVDELFFPCAFPYTLNFAKYDHTPAPTRQKNGIGTIKLESTSRNERQT